MPWAEFPGARKQPILYPVRGVRTRPPVTNGSVNPPAPTLFAMPPITTPASSPASWFARPLFRWSLGIVGSVIAGALLFEALGISVFSRIGMPHEFCYLREPKLVWLHVISDLLIGVAYVSISVTLAYLVFKASKGIPFHWVFLAFGLFIVSCGFTH